MLVNDIRSEDSMDDFYKEPEVIEIKSKHKVPDEIERKEITPDMLPPHLQRLVVPNPEEQASMYIDNKYKKIIKMAKHRET